MNQKILLVDDREDNLFSMETILETDGYQFVKASSGKQALKILLNEVDFALILMDVQMPNLNGFETAALIYQREKLKHIPIIFITAYKDGEENVFKGYKTGAVDYIYKPLNPDLLRAKVTVFVDLYVKNNRLLQQEQKLKAINKSLENEIKEKNSSEAKVRELNKQLLENVARLESVNKDLDRFAFMASHDLQEPLRKILTFSDMLVTKFPEKVDDESHELLKRIQNASARMQALIKDLLTFSRISNEKDDFQHTDLNQLLKEVLADLDSIIREKQAKIEYDTLPFIYANPGLIRPLFFNLIGNALKYSKPAMPPHICIRTDIVALPSSQGEKKPEQYCRIFVEDNGIGFEQQYAEQIFEMFKRLHHVTQFEGTGIGLALCKKIVEKHNGFISAKSTLDVGTTFIVSLPMSQQTMASAPPVDNITVGNGGVLN